ncbi:MAG TPA: hypothetical protein VHK27_07095 [Gammaproteobacteria bacterium]|nr:hypothetical protein [Gammaproteobacteria bacterium]
MPRDTPIPIEAAEAERIAEMFGYDQIIIIGRRVGGEGSEWVTTYGRGNEHSEAARLIGEFLKYKVMRWRR